MKINIFSLNQIPDVLGTMFAIAVINLNAEYLLNAINAQPMYGMFVIDIIYGLTLIIVRVIVQCHPSNSEKC